MVYYFNTNCTVHYDWMITGNAIACCTESLVELSAHLAVIVVKTQSSSINRNVKIKRSNSICDFSGNSICDASGMCHI